MDSHTLAAYTELWLREIAPTKLAKSTLARDKQDIDRFMPYLGGYMDSHRSHILLGK